MNLRVVFVVVTTFYTKFPLLSSLFSCVALHMIIFPPPLPKGASGCAACGPCSAGPIPRPARRRPGPFEKGLREAVGIDLLALLLH